MLSAATATVLALVLLAATTASASAQLYPAAMVYYGSGLDVGDVVTTHVAGVECDSATVDADGWWRLEVTADCGGGVQIEDGAEIAFAVNGEPVPRFLISNPYGFELVRTATWIASEWKALPGGGWWRSERRHEIVFSAQRILHHVSARYYGSGLDVGDVVTAHVAGVECASATVSELGWWEMLVAPDCGRSCVVQIEDAAEISFAVNGEPVHRFLISSPTLGSSRLVSEVVQTAIWAPGWLYRITLTLASDPIAGDIGDGAVYYGSGLAEGDVVTARLDLGAGRGAACASATVDADGSWRLEVPRGSCDMPGYFGGIDTPGWVLDFWVNDAFPVTSSIWVPGITNRIAILIGPP